MSNFILRSLKKTKLRLFLFFLLVALIFWVLTKFSREYTAAVEAHIAYISLPENVSIASNNKRIISFEVTANGFDFLFYKFKQPQINVSVLKYYNEGETQLIVSKEDLIGLISNQLTKNLSVQNLSVNQLTINLDELVSKKVKVKLKVDVSFKDGFKAIDSFRLKPDSITISGPSELIKKIKFVETQTYAQKDIDKSINDKIALAGMKDTKINFNQKEVVLKLEVAEFSQQEISIPIDIINVPPSKSIKIIPQNITVVFDVSLKYFNEINENSFRVVCDFNDRNSEENFMVPKLTQSPEFVRNATLNLNKIDFLIFK